MAFFPCKREMQPDNRYPAMCWNWRFFKVIWTVLCLTYLAVRSFFHQGVATNITFSGVLMILNWTLEENGEPWDGFQSLIQNPSFQLCLPPLLIPVACIKDTVCLALWYWTCWGEALGRPLNVLVSSQFGQHQVHGVLFCSFFFK